MTLHLDDMGIDERGEYILNLEQQIGTLKSALEKHNSISWGVISEIVFEQVMLENANEEFEKSFELYTDACRRGIKLWREADEGPELESWHREMVSPDQANLVAFLLALVERAEGAIQELEGKQ